MFARLHAGDAPPDLPHDTRALVAKDGGEQALGVVARQGEGIGVANAGGLGLDQHLAVARPLQIDLDDFERLTGSEGNGGVGFHGGLRQDGGGPHLTQVPTECRGLCERLRLGARSLYKGAVRCAFHPCTMLFGIPLPELTFLAAALLAAGAVTGLLAGVFGVGGGAVIVPVLYELFNLLGLPEPVRMPLCVGTSLAIIIPTSWSSFNAHRKKGAVDMSIVRVWAVPVVIGVLLGSLVARIAPPDLFKGVFVLVAGASAIRLLFGKDNWIVSTALPGLLAMRAIGGGIGVLSSLMGIGGGQLSNLFMTFYGRPIHQAVATSSGLGLLIALPGTLGYIYAGWDKAMLFPTVAALQPPLALGHVSLIGFLLFVPTSIWTAPIGARLAHALPKRRLEVAFGIFLTIVCLRFVASFVTG